MIAIPDLPSGLDGLRILHIADTHFPANGASLPRFLRSVAALDYDLVFATGDYVDSQRGWPVALEAFRRLEPKLGTIAVIGGHERYGDLQPLPALRNLLQQGGGLHRRGRQRARTFVDPTPFIQGLQAVGVQVLVNSATTLEVGGETIRVVGVDDAYLGLADLESALTKSGVGPSAGLTVLLSHSPDGVPAQGLSGTALSLCGHTHGGQIRIPGWGAPVRHARSVDRRRPAGLLRFGETPVYASRGFGTTSVPFRFACRPELGTVELRRADR